MTLPVDTAAWEERPRGLGELTTKLGFLRQGE